jgi:hypothetical protein
MFTACCSALKGATLRDQEVSADALSCTLTFSVLDLSVWETEFPALLRTFNSVGATSRAERVYEWRGDRFGSFWRVVIEAPNDDIMLRASYTTLAPPRRFVPQPVAPAPSGKRMVPAAAATTATPAGPQHVVLLGKTKEKANSAYGARQITTVRLVGRPEDRNYQATTDWVHPTAFKGPKAYAKLTSQGAEQ